MLMTARPCADAERWANEQDEADALRETAQREAPMIVLRRLHGMKQAGDWFKDCIHTGKNWSPSEILDAALESDDDTISAFSELMTGTGSTARLLQAMATFFGSAHAIDIYTNEMVNLHDDL